MVMLSDWPLESDKSDSPGDSADEFGTVVFAELPTEGSSKIESDGRFVVSLRAKRH